MVSLINFKTVDGELESGESVSVRVEDSGTGESDGSQRASQQSQQLQAHTQARRTKNSIYFNEKTQVEHSNEPLEIPNFVVTWRQLRFAIEPKWHQRLRNSTLASALTRSGSRGATTSGKQREKSQLKTKDQSKLVLDRLDGSFRSGELTAILGPSGKFTC